MQMALHIPRTHGGNIVDLAPLQTFEREANQARISFSAPMEAPTPTSKHMEDHKCAQCAEYAVKVKALECMGSQLVLALRKIRDESRSTQTGTRDVASTAGSRNKNRGEGDEVVTLLREAKTRA